MREQPTYGAYRRQLKPAKKLKIIILKIDQVSTVAP
jgi:hypothetical protein